MVDLKALKLLRLIQSLEDMPARVRSAFRFWANCCQTEEVDDDGVNSVETTVAAYNGCNTHANALYSVVTNLENTGGEMLNLSKDDIPMTETLGDDVSDDALKSGSFSTETSLDEDQFTPVQLKLADDALEIMEFVDDEPEMWMKCAGATDSDMSSMPDDDNLDILHSMTQLHQKLTGIARRTRLENLKLQKEVLRLNDELDRSTGFVHNYENLKTQYAILQAEYINLTRRLHEIHELSTRNIYRV